MGRLEAQSPNNEDLPLNEDDERFGRAIGFAIIFAGKAHGMTLPVA